MPYSFICGVCFSIVYMVFSFCFVLFYFPFNLSVFRVYDVNTGPMSVCVYVCMTAYPRVKALWKWERKHTLTKPKREIVNERINEWVNKRMYNTHICVSLSTLEIECVRMPKTTNNRRLLLLFLLLIGFSV